MGCSRLRKFRGRSVGDRPLGVPPASRRWCVSPAWGRASRRQRADKGTAVDCGLSSLSGHALLSQVVGLTAVHGEVKSSALHDFFFTWYAARVCVRGRAGPRVAELRVRAGPSLASHCSRKASTHSVCPTKPSFVCCPCGTSCPAGERFGTCSTTQMSARAWTLCRCGGPCGGVGMLVVVTCRVGVCESRRVHSVHHRNVS